MAVPMLLYKSESWIKRKRDKSRIQAAEIKFRRSVKGLKFLTKIYLETKRLEKH